MFLRGGGVIPQCTLCTAKKKKHIVYPNLQSAIHQVEHSENFLVPKPPDQEIQSSSSADEHSSGEYVGPNDPESENKPIRFSHRLRFEAHVKIFLFYFFFFFRFFDVSFQF